MAEDIAPRYFPLGTVELLASKKGHEECVTHSLLDFLLTDVKGVPMRQSVAVISAQEQIKSQEPDENGHVQIYPVRTWAKMHPERLRAAPSGAA